MCSCRIGTYRIGAQLAKGSFSTIRYAINEDPRDTSTLCVKIVNKSQFQTKKDLKLQMSEVEILSKVDHPNIVKLYDVIEDEQNIYIFMEYCQGTSLLSFINSRSSISERVCRIIFKQIIIALSFLHNKGIAHRDLKLENIIVSSSYEVKIIDFGFSSEHANDCLLTTYCGSYYYSAPEVLNNQPYIGSSADMWSSGVVLFALVMGSLPFYDNCLPKLINKITLGNYTISSSISKSCADLISKLLCVDPKKRLTADQALRHDWFSDSYTASWQSGSLPERFRCNLTKFNSCKNPRQSQNHNVTIVSRQHQNGTPVSNSKAIYCSKASFRATKTASPMALTFPENDDLDISFVF
ncbi:CAMK family protein kinase [Histomonas meleagridis]|uniref:CAMK family protein kinase n=1 Tax=Histomonas meleagridis TaxID=135588 RepID=UPI0035595550|nr:CAMK family protein kinase [Histomonas meleagridis]KAH0804485.1 CAMK family protein kinase [Histomonas meleagridis]